MEFDSLDFLTNFSRTLLQATNPAGDRLWVFNAPENPLDQLLKLSGAKEAVATANWSEGHVAEISVPSQMAFDSSNRRISTGWQLHLRMNLARRDSVRLAFFTTVSECDMLPGRRLTNVLTDVQVRTNVYFGARVTVPTNGAVLLLSGRTNSEGKYFGALLSPLLP